VTFTLKVLFPLVLGCVFPYDSYANTGSFGSFD